MERDTLIKISAAGVVLFFILEMFTIRSTITSQQQQQTNQSTNETPVYGIGTANATLYSYMGYLTLSKQGVDLTNNASIMQLGNLQGVGFINNQSGAVNLVLDNTENVTTVAHEVEGMFSDINVTARALFSISSAVQFQTQAGVRNVTVLFLIPIDTEPDIEMGDNITLSLTGILYGNTLTTSPTARVIPTESNIVASAEVSKLGDNYTAAFIFPWKSRNEMVSFGSKLPPSVKNASFNYSASSFVGVKGLSLQSNETLNKIINLSYVQEVNGDLVYVNESMNNTDEIERDIKSIVGSNTTVDYPISVMTVSFLSSNFSNSDLTAPSEGEVLVYRGTTIEVRGNVTIGGINYTIPSSSGTFNVMLLDNYTIGQNISVNIAVGTIGRRITSFNLNNA